MLYKSQCIAPLQCINIHYLLLNLYITANLYIWDLLFPAQRQANGRQHFSSANYLATSCYSCCPEASLSFGLQLTKILNQRGTQIKV